MASLVQWAPGAQNVPKQAHNHNVRFRLISHSRIWRDGPGPRECGLLPGLPAWGSFSSDGMGLPRRVSRGTPRVARSGPLGKGAFSRSRFTPTPSPRGGKPGAVHRVSRRIQQAPRRPGGESFASRRGQGAPGPLNDRHHDVQKMRQVDFGSVWGPPEGWDPPQLPVRRPAGTVRTRLRGQERPRIQAFWTGNGPSSSTNKGRLLGPPRLQAPEDPEPDAAAGSGALRLRGR